MAPTLTKEHAHGATGGTKPNCSDSTDKSSVLTDQELNNNDKQNDQQVTTLLKTQGSFMENFNPTTSSRETRKLRRKAAGGIKLKKHATIYDEKGMHRESGKDFCDCLDERCDGCHMPCPKCESRKCGHECRVNRKWGYESVELDGNNITRSNPYEK